MALAPSRGVKLAIIWLFLVTTLGAAHGQNNANAGYSAAESATSVGDVGGDYGQSDAWGAGAAADAAAESARETLRRLESTLVARTAHLQLLRALSETTEEQRRQENLLIDEIRAQRGAAAELRAALRDAEQP